MGSLLLKNLVVAPYLRQADYAVRHPWSYGNRRLLDYLLVYVEKGHCRFTVDHVPYDFYEGDVCLVQPGSLVILEGLTDTVTPFAHLDFFYNQNREQSFPTSAGMTNLDNYAHLIQPKLNDVSTINIPVLFRPSRPLAFKNKLIRMISHWKEGTVIGQIEVQQLGTELLLEMIRDFGELMGEQESTLASLDRVLAYISLNLHEKITVKDMAEQVHLSPSRFSTVFREKFGVSPYQFLLKFRIERAIEMLQGENNYSVTQVSEFCGFNNIQHFSKALKDATGKSPSMFRTTKEKSLHI